MNTFIADILNLLADETDDAADHDKLHAASDVVRAGLSTPYIDRWVGELLKRHHLSAVENTAR